MPVSSLGYSLLSRLRIWHSLQQIYICGNIQKHVFSILPSTWNALVVQIVSENTDIYGWHSFFSNSRYIYSQEPFTWFPGIAVGKYYTYFIHFSSVKWGFQSGRVCTFSVFIPTDSAAHIYSIVGD